MSTLPYVVTVQADLTGTTAFGAAPTWTDITAHVLPTGIGAPIDITSWRQDERSDVSPTTATITVDNTAGTYTPGATGILPGARFRVTVTIAGVDFHLVDGYATEFSQGYVSSVKPVTRVSIVDAFARFGTLQPLRSILAEEIMVDTPTSYYPLDEDVAATSAGDETGANAPGVIVNSKYGAGTLDFGVIVNNDFTGTKAMVAMTSPDAGAATRAARGTFLRLPKTVLGSGAFTLELWVWPPATAPANPVAIATSLWHSNLSYGTNTDSFDLYIDGTGVVEAHIVGSVDLIAVIGATNICDGHAHHVAMTLSADGKTAKVYIDGAQDATASVAADIVFQGAKAPVYLGVGVQFGQVFGPLSASLAAFATFPADLGATRVLAHYTAGATAFAGESSDAHVARLLTYRPNLGSSLDAGLGDIGVHDTEGVTLQQALLDTAKAEVGLVYIDGTGQVVLRNRGHQFNPAVTLTLDASIAEISTETEFRIDDQDVVNDATISRPRGADQRVFDAASVALYGTRDGSDTRIVNTDAAAADIASYLVESGKTPQPRTPNVTVDIATLTSTTTAKAVLGLKPLDRVVVANLPATAPPVDVLVQGRQISLGVAAFDVTFYTSVSPVAAGLAALTWDDATFGAWDDNVWGF